MTSSARCRANRENARRSTGPRTAAGKRRSSGNARRHGLAIPIEAIPQLDAEAEQLAQVLAGDRPSEARLQVARRMAEAEVDLRRIRQARHEAIRLMVEDPQAWVDQTTPRFHFVKAVRKDWSQVLIALRLAQADATNARMLALSAWSRTLDRLQRYERRALSRRKTAARDLADLDKSEGDATDG